MASKVENKDPLLSLEDAAEYLSVTKRWMRRAIQERRIRTTRLGRRVYFRLSWLEEYIDSQASEASNEL